VAERRSLNYDIHTMCSPELTKPCYAYGQCLWWAHDLIIHNCEFPTWFLVQAVDQDCPVSAFGTNVVTSEKTKPPFRRVWEVVAKIGPAEKGFYESKL